VDEKRSRQIHIGLTRIRCTAGIGQLVQIGPAVTAHLDQIVPHLSGREVIPALESGVLVWAGLLLQQGKERTDRQPFGLGAAALAQRTGLVALVRLAGHTFGLAHRQVSLAVTTRAAGENPHLDHDNTSLKQKSPPQTRRESTGSSQTGREPISRWRKSRAGYSVVYPP